MMVIVNLRAVALRGSSSGVGEGIAGKGVIHVVRVAVLVVRDTRGSGPAEVRLVGLSHIWAAVRTRVISPRCIPKRSVRIPRWLIVAQFHHPCWLVLIFTSENS